MISGNASNSCRKVCDLSLTFQTHFTENLRQFKFIHVQAVNCMRANKLKNKYIYSLGNIEEPVYLRLTQLCTIRKFQSVYNYRVLTLSIWFGFENLMKLPKNLKIVFQSLEYTSTNHRLPLEIDGIY